MKFELKEKGEEMWDVRVFQNYETRVRFEGKVQNEFSYDQFSSLIWTMKQTYIKFMKTEKIQKAINQAAREKMRSDTKLTWIMEVINLVE